MSEIQSEYLTEMLHHLPESGLKTIPQPWFITDLFPEEPFTICRPLFPPFDLFAVTHTGQVFQYQPLITQPFGEDFREIHPAMIIPQYKTRTDRHYIKLQDIRTGYRHNFFTDVLVSHLFYGTHLSPKTTVEHLNGNTLDDHYLNLDAPF